MATEISISLEEEVGQTLGVPMSMGTTNGEI